MATVSELRTACRNAGIGTIMRRGIRIGIGRANSSELQAALRNAGVRIPSDGPVVKKPSQPSVVASIRRVITLTGEGCNGDAFRVEFRRFGDGSVEIIDQERKGNNRYEDDEDDGATLITTLDNLKQVIALALESEEVTHGGGIGPTTPATGSD